MYSATDTIISAAGRAIISVSDPAGKRSISIRGQAERPRFFSAPRIREAAISGPGTGYICTQIATHPWLMV